MRYAPGRFSIEKRMLHWILDAIGRPPVRLVLKNGPDACPAGAAPVASLIIHDRAALLRMALHPELGFGDGYAAGSIEVEGDLVAALEAVYRSISSQGGYGWITRKASYWKDRIKANTPTRSRENVHHHYDLTGDFYRRWLDPELVYTCAYFPNPSTPLEEAQAAKLEYVCRKLQLRPGERVAEAGFGWGALSLHMARRYGVRVTAFNLSHEQTVFARQRARAEGLDGLVDFIEDDYRNISGRFDAFVSVGMLEHVGAHHYPDLGKVLHRTVGASGRGLIHFIGRNSPAPLSLWIRKRIFPGAYAPSLREVVEIFEPWDISVRDVENLRMHYAWTLEHWIRRFEHEAPNIARMFDPRFVRIWRLYLAGSLTAFRTGTLQLFQIVFSGSECDRIPWTRRHVYEPDSDPQRSLRWTHSMS